jgi:hypothetical protein
MGTRNGRAAVQALYKGDCDNAWGLANQAKTMKTRKFPTNQGSPSKRAENQCARNAIDKEVAKIEKRVSVPVLINARKLVMWQHKSLFLTMVARQITALHLMAPQRTTRKPVARLRTVFALDKSPRILLCGA